VQIHANRGQWRAFTCAPHHTHHRRPAARSATSRGDACQTDMGPFTPLSPSPSVMACMQAGSGRGDGMNPNIPAGGQTRNGPLPVKIATRRERTTAAGAAGPWPRSSRRRRAGSAGPEWPHTPSREGLVATPLDGGGAWFHVLGDGCGRCSCGPGWASGVVVGDAEAAKDGARVGSSDPFRSAGPSSTAHVVSVGGYLHVARLVLSVPLLSPRCSP
jgi:hypothetical protein